MKKNTQKQSYFSYPLLILGLIWLACCFFGIGKKDEYERKRNCCNDQLKEITADKSKPSDSLFSIRKNEDMNQLLSN